MKKQFDLTDFRPYLLNRAGLKAALSFARDIDELNVTLPMWRVMAGLRENDDQRLGEPAERTSIDPSTLSRLLGGLQRKQFVAQRRSGEDGRALSVSLTARGREMVEKIIPIALHYEDVALRGLTAGEVKQLKRMLVKLFSNVQTFDEEYEVRMQKANAAKANAKAGNRRPTSDRKNK